MCHKKMYSCGDHKQVLIKRSSESKLLNAIIMSQEPEYYIQARNDLETQ